MNIGKSKELCDQIPKEDIPLMKMIDKKINNDMDKVLNEIKAIESKIDSVEKSLKSELSGNTRVVWYCIIAIVVAIAIKTFGG